MYTNFLLVSYNYKRVTVNGLVGSLVGLLVGRSVKLSSAGRDKLASGYCHVYLFSVIKNKGTWAQIKT